MPSPLGDPSEAEASTGGGTPQLPWNLIPKFVPGTTNVQEYVQKLRFLAAMWPAEHLSQLAPRAALLVEGTAFKKIALLDPMKLRVNDQSGIALLVDAIGGSWGSTDFEEKYDGTTQRNDESHDSFLSRMEANFMELINRGTKLEEVQAYVLLRQSLLPAEDKKRILVEHAGNLQYAPVVRSFRLLGSKFFNDLQGGRVQTKTKVYDANITEVHEADVFKATEDFSVERAFTAHVEDSDDLDAETFEAFLAAEDQDALVIQSFEQELEEYLQETPEMHEAMVSYLEARNRLLEKKRSRGFWPIKAKGSHGGSFKGKSKGKGKKQRENLLSRIARSYCRKCGAKGHWKAECPQNAGARDPDSNPAAANMVETVPIFAAESMIHEVHSESDMSEPDPVAWPKVVAPSKIHKPKNEFPLSDFADAFVVGLFRPDNHDKYHSSDLSGSIKKLFGFQRSHRFHNVDSSRRFQVLRRPVDRNLSSAGPREPIVSVGSIPEVFLAQDGQIDLPRHS